MRDDTNETHEKTTTESSTSVEDTTVPVGSQLAILASILLLIFGTGYIPHLMRSFETNTANGAATVPESAPEPPQPAEQEARPDHFADVELRGDAAYVWDVQQQRALYQQNADQQLPLASVTKLMTALVAYELIDENGEIPITVSAILQDGDSGFHEGESFALRDILDLTLMTSSNDGAFAIASAVGAELLPEGDAATFVEAMNVRASELGLTQTYFRNPTGLDISTTEGGAYGSARDITFLMEYILSNYPEILEATKEDTDRIANDNGLTHLAENTNPAISQIPGLIGSKTGYTDLAGGNLVVAFDAAFNRPVIVVVLGSTRSGRFDDVLMLVDRAQKTIKTE